MRQRPSSAARGRSCAHPPRAAPPMRFYVPLATSPSEFGFLGLSTPDTFRPWPFSCLRRFTPPTASLLYFIQAPPIGFKEHERCCVVPRVPKMVRPKISRFRNTKPERAACRSRPRGPATNSAARPAPRATSRLLPRTSMRHSPRCSANGNTQGGGHTNTSDDTDTASEEPTAAASLATDPSSE